MSRYVEMVIPREFRCIPGCSELLTKLGFWSSDKLLPAVDLSQSFLGFLRRCGKLPLLPAPRGCGLILQFGP